MLDATTLSLIGSFSKENSLSIITGIKFNSNLLKAYNNMTFMFDPNWTYNEQEPDFPLAFFFVKKMHEVSESEVSQKPMLFYNADVSGGDSVKAGLMNIVADNIIIKPKVYKADVIIPMDATSYFNGAFWHAESIARIEKFIFSRNGDEGSGLSQFFRVTDSVLGFVKTLIKALYGTSLSASSIMTMLAGQQDFNKNSIDSMWKSRRFIRLKLWTGWKFKDLVIQHFECTKSGEDGDYFEGTITFQEVPILTFRNGKNLKTASEKFSSAVGTVMKKATTAFINAMETSAGSI